LRGTLSIFDECDVARSEQEAVDEFECLTCTGGQDDLRRLGGNPDLAEQAGNVLA
jgi:hypothetical protein